MYPILGSLPDEILLRATGRGVAQRRVTTRADKIVQSRELDNELVVVIAEERLCIQARGEDRAEGPAGLFLPSVSIPEE